MTFDQAQDAFRKHKTYTTADVYLDNVTRYQAGDAIGDGILFDAVGEVASWLSASDEHLRGLEAVKGKHLCLAEVAQEIVLQARSYTCQSGAATRGQHSGAMTRKLEGKVAVVTGGSARLAG